MRDAIRPRNILLMFFCLFAIWIAEDLYWPRHHDLRRFDPVQVATLETAMWRSYYDHRALDLFGQMTRLLRQEYGMPLWRSSLAAYYAARAAEVFQRGHNRGDYERALPLLLSYYQIVLRTSQTSFDPAETARLELEWWIAHRERGRPAPSARATDALELRLELGLARLQSSIYRLPPERFSEHARARAQAMLLRDAKADAGLAPSDWMEIDRLLVVSWSSLHRAVE